MAVDSVEKMMRADAASRALGIEVLTAAPGLATTAMTVRPDMANGHGIAHGAFVFAVADTAFACACNSHGPVTVAATADIAFLAPARVGDTLYAHAGERIRFGRSGIYDVTVRRDHPDTGEVIAEFRGTSRTLREQP